MNHKKPIDHSLKIYLSILLFAITVFVGTAREINTRADSVRITVSDGTELHVTVRGDGIPCLYIHGGPGVGSFWMEKIYGGVLEKHFKMIYLDQRGSGRSGSAANGDYSAERMAKDFEEVRKALGIDSWITFSHSFGGILQMKHIQLYPENISGMIMVAPTINLNESAEEMIAHALVLLEIEAEQQQPYLDKSKQPIDRFWPLFEQLRKQDLFWKPYYAVKQNSVRMDSVMALVPNPNYEFGNRAFGMPEYFANYKSSTSNIDVPVLLYFGKKDYAVGPSHYRGIEFPNMTLHFWNGGHVPFMEGRNELEQAITNWIGINYRMDFSNSTK